MRAGTRRGEKDGEAICKMNLMVLSIYCTEVDCVSEVSRIWEPEHWPKTEIRKTSDQFCDVLCCPFFYLQCDSQPLARAIRGLISSYCSLYISSLM